MTCDAHPIVSRAQALRLLASEPELFVVYDRNVAWVKDEVCETLPVRGALALDAAEEAKTMDTVLTVCRWLLEAGATRGALLLAIGGGFTTDITGFAAAIYKRGIRYANIPTTLLGQVDAAIGGKTGVDLDGYKNMLGAFRMPEFTALEPAFLHTLPPREWRCGWAEMLKTFLIADPDAYTASIKIAQNMDTTAETPVASTKIAENMDAEGEAMMCEGNLREMEPWIRMAAEIKAAIVGRDPLEGGERAKLNLGHTFGHAIEHLAQLRGHDIAHGEAVAMGILLAARVSEGLAACRPAPAEAFVKGLAARLAADFAAVGLPTECPYPVEELLGAIEKDKKATGEKVKFVLPHAPGSVFLQELTPQEAYDCYLHTE